MVVPVSVIMVICLIAFVLTYFQYYRLDPRRRIRNLRFVVMACTAACAVSYPPIFGLMQTNADFARISLAYLVAAVLLLMTSCTLQYRMPRPNSAQQKP